jgi:heat shock protein HtpX
MSNLYSQREENIWKTWVFLGIFSVLVMGLGWFIAVFYDNAFIFVFAILLAIFGNFFSYWYADKVILKLHKAHPATREAYFDLWNATENLAITAGLPMPDLYVIEDSSPNAFATGRDKDHAVICVTNGLLQILNKTELEGVIAHELSHIGNNDMLLSTVVVVLAGFVALLSDFFLRSQAFKRSDRERNGGPLIPILGTILALLTPLAATLIRLAISRKREFLADASGALLTRYPEGLASALRKIDAAATPLKSANKATAYLFISNPFGSGMQAVNNLFLTHPPVAERIHALIDVNEPAQQRRAG